ncbi:unnamed protein product [Effrenium voratum]|nr:unnamed protein product [Effrenium voratum]
MSPRYILQIAGQLQVDHSEVSIRFPVHQPQYAEAPPPSASTSPPKAKAIIQKIKAGMQEVRETKCDVTAQEISQRVHSIQAALGIKRGQGGEWNEIAQQRIETWLLTARRRTLQSNVPQLALEDKSGSPKRKKASKPGSTAVSLENAELETKVADLEAGMPSLRPSCVP